MRIVLFAQQCDDINIMAILVFFKTSLVIDDDERQVISALNRSFGLFLTTG
ncbi:hypothetical protein MOSL_0052 [Moraxella osloensis]|nr:hypothetical protein MOSL_0052 [Moraxella osloensis]